MPKQVYGRPPVKTNFLVAHLRQRIVTGEWQPRERLPTRRELSEQFGVSSVTTQQALSRLVAEGFVVPRGTHGTFVAAEPPHLGHYAVVFPETAAQIMRNHFWLAMQHAARTLMQGEGLRLKCYYGTTASDIIAEDHTPLLDDIMAHRLAGLVFVTSPWRYAETPVLDEPGIARVAITPTPNRFPKIATVSLGASMVEKSLDYLLERGRRQVAVLAPPQTPDTWGEPFMKALAARGMSTRPYWRQILSPGAPDGARPCLHLMLHAGQSDRPDGLVIADDNLVTMATAGIVDAGVRVPQDLEVVAHTNFPWPTPSLVPVRHLGYDAGEVLRRCLAACEAQRHGQGVPPTLIMPATFGDEKAMASRTTTSPVHTFVLQPQLG
jgi:DNA-binding LacI/PurR family transcriptional regulator